MEIDIRRTSVRDLTPLRSVESLSQLYVDKDFPKDQIDALQRALPDCQIIQD